VRTSLLALIRWWGSPIPEWRSATRRMSGPVRQGGARDTHVIKRIDEDFFDEL
jgi:hypothetical protein